MSILEDLENLFYGRTPPTDVEIQSALRDWKNGVRVGTTAALTLATDLEAGDTLDGITLAEGDRVLVKDQADASENGIYNVSASGAPSRASDMEATADAAGAILVIGEGNTQADTIWICTDDSPTIVGVDNITFVPFMPSGTASTATQIIAGAGLTGGGTLAADRTLDVGANADGSIVVNANDVQVGVLATDAQHGNRGRGSLHTVATTSEAGFMSAADKTKLDSGAAGGVVQIDGSGNSTVPNNVTATAGYLKTGSAGTLANPSVRVADDTTGLYRPATSQLGLAANNKAVIVDNDSATPSLRGDADATWSLGEVAVAYGSAYAYNVVVPEAGAAVVTLTSNVLQYGVNKDFAIQQTAPSAGQTASKLTLSAGAGGAASGAAGKTGANLDITAGAGGAADATYDAGDGGTVTITGGAGGTQGLGGTSDGGDVVIKAGAGDGGSNGDVLVGTTQTKNITVGATGATTTVAGPLVCGDRFVTSVRSLGTSTFTIDGDDAGKLGHWTGTSTGVAGTVNSGVAGQVTTLVLTGTAGTVTLTAGSGVTLEAEEGKTLTTNAPGASTAVTVSLLYLTATHVVATGGLA